VSSALKLKFILHACDLSEEIKTKCVGSILVSKQASKVNVPLHVTRPKGIAQGKFLKVSGKLRFYGITKACRNPILELRSRVHRCSTLPSYMEIQQAFLLALQPNKEVHVESAAQLLTKDSFSESSTSVSTQKELN
jgi:hypothetical protein